jgi:hypothetical protein
LLHEAQPLLDSGGYASSFYAVWNARVQPILSFFNPQQQAKRMKEKDI